MQKIESGKYGRANGDGGWMLYNGIGQRRCIESITFETKFDEAPTMVVTLSGYEIYQGHHHRIRVFADNVTAEGFDLVIETWSDTQVFSAEASWIAHGV